MNDMTPHSPAGERRRRIRRPVVSDQDGTREGGLSFCIVFILAFIAASVAHPMALQSFWVWVVMLSMSISVAVGVQRGVAYLNGFEEPKDDDDASAQEYDPHV